MGAITDLWNSERGLVAVALIIGATVLTALGSMTIGQWTEFSTVIFGVYAAAKTVTGTVAIVKSKKTGPDAAPTPPTV